MHLSGLKRNLQALDPSNIMSEVSDTASKTIVVYLDWSFAFGLSPLRGMRVFDVRYNGERIVYELSVQEAMSVYGSVTPNLMLTKFLDGSLGTGVKNVFQVKDKEFVNVSLPWMPEHHAMIPRIVEKEL